MKAQPQVNTTGALQDLRSWPQAGLRQRSHGGWSRLAQTLVETDARATNGIRPRRGSSPTNSPWTSRSLDGSPPRSPDSPKRS